MKISIALILLQLVCSQCSAQLPANLTRQNLNLTLLEPVAVRHAGDGSGRIFIAEQSGTIKIYNGTTQLTANFLDISAKVQNSGEQGLLGLDFDPDYTTNGYFYVYYSKSGTNQGDSIIERYTVSGGDANIADVNSGVIIMRIAQPFSNHNGGDIHFGPDGYLYIGTGDGGSGGDPGNRAQSLNTLLGKMLRIDVSSTEPVFSDSFETTASSCGLDSVTGSYKIPYDNPFLSNTSACAEIWSYGLRNPYRWSFDKLTGDLIIGDVGQNTYEEVDFQAASSKGGENYGWRCREGAHDFNTSLCTGNETFTEPVIDLPQSSNNGCSVMGGYVYRGSAIPTIQGLYLFSDFCGGEVNFTDPNSNWSFDMLEDVNFGTRGFGEDEQGEIYHIFNNDIYKFILN
jgi:glucose/arabinose dehydrogenase